MNKQELQNEFIKAVKHRRIDNPVTNTDLAVLCGVTKGYLNEVLNGRKALSFSLYSSLIEHLKISANYISEE